ncbi:MAG: Translation-associated GTPase [Microgenomates group bacterium GW2011_GWC1_41_20]|uniref:Ribosome-binding ATPase YchF n=2 Tax=Candidatus Woeseibacteriota TaxID=1752722 RepID=A0A0G0U7V2_9BACT|nr:MAG: Translation-associated GTPase [Candidatus Woesebacteria bacterium GW2011_GWF1_40_24]KKS00582.1 MAG: Translation-associated GTPase [Microgenomates group bacterium GW2011_GWC1_41_20]KKS05129.1 MAG: Translation-associated GTPase [Candidatus Woesebacteria bacterium GW2011_GWE1_41_24]
MSLSVGIVGLPNVGKSTLFNALLKKQQAYVANFPFATIEPNIGVVPVPDERLSKLAEVTKKSESMVNLPPEVPATVEFVDIAGLIAGASKGEGLGNKFLSHIRETSAICHVVRAFNDPEIVKQGITDPITDLDTVETELKLADFQTLEKQKDPGNTPNKELVKWWEVVGKLKDALQKGIPARDVLLSEEETKIAKSLSLLTAKPILVVLNVDENDLSRGKEIEAEFAKKMKLDLNQIVIICAKTESELSDLSAEDQKVYMKDLGIEKSGLERLIQKAFATLGLITFLTAGEKEVRAWTIKDGINAQEAAGVIHTDFIKKFIKADIVSFDDFVNFSGWKASRDLGKVRSEGRDYIMMDGEVVEFKIGT